ncbi:MAG: hypothetical protein JXK94_15835 [Deltaproteobacteria bacterium]|nr:hypothetical protein [Deltaproteobacteria bacterium]
MRQALDHVAQLMTGGLVIQSAYGADGDQAAIYAQTVIQLDGDVVTAYHPDTLMRADFEVLAASHLKEVDAAIIPLQKLVENLGRVRYVAIIAGALGLFISSVAGWYSLEWKSILGWVVSFLVTVGGTALRCLFLMNVRRRVGRLWLEGKKEAEELVPL